MAEEVEKSTEATDQEAIDQEKVVPDDTSLDTAADEINQEPVTEEQKEESEIVIETPEDAATIQKKIENDEKSRVGRKIAALQRDQQERNDKMDILVDKFDRYFSKQESLNEPEVDIDEPVTLRSLQEYEAKKESESREQTDSYTKIYQNKVNEKLTREDESVRAGIFDEFKTNYNIRNSSGLNNPAVDAELNLKTAETAYYKKLLSSPDRKVNPLKGIKPASPMGGGTATTVKTNKITLPAMDKIATSLAEGLTEEEITNAMK